MENTVQIKKIIEIMYQIAIKIKHDYYLEELYRFNDFLTKKDKLKLLKAELTNLKDVEIINWFYSIEFETLTSLGIARLLKVLMNNSGIECEVVKCFEDVNKVDYYINKIKINELWYNVDLPRNLEYFIYHIYPKILCTNLDLEYLIFDYEELEKFRLEEAKEKYNIENEYSKHVNNKKISKKTLIGLKKLEIQMQENFNNKMFSRYYNQKKYLLYSEFENISSEEIQKKRNNSIYLDIDKDIEEIVNAGGINIIIKNINKIYEVCISINKIYIINENKEVLEFIELLKKRNIVVKVYDLKEKIIYESVEKLQESLELIFKWKNEIEKEIKKIDKKEFLKLNSELKEKELEDFLKFKMIYIKMQNNLVIDKYFSNELLGFKTHLNKDGFRYIINSQNLERAKIGYCICASFSIILKCLLDIFGLENNTIIGLSSRKISHRWNKVKIGDNYYNLDYMWDTEIISKYKDITKFLLKSDNDFQEHIFFDDNFKKAFKSLNIDLVNRNFNYNEFLKYRSEKEQNRLNDIIAENEKLVYYNRNEKYFYSKYTFLTFKEFMSRIKKTKFVDEQIYYKYIALKIEKDDIFNFIDNQEIVFKYIGHIEYIEINLSKYSEYKKSLRKLVNKLSNKKFEKFDFIFLNIEDTPNKNYLHEFK